MKKKYIVIILLAVILTFFLCYQYSQSNYRDFNCSDFRDREELSKIFNSYDSDVFGLDRDNDGIPCEEIK